MEKWEKLTEISNQEGLLPPPTNLPQLPLLPGAELCRAMLVEAIEQGRDILVLLTFVSFAGDAEIWENADFVATEISDYLGLKASWNIPLKAATVASVRQELYG